MSLTVEFSSCVRLPPYVVIYSCNMTSKTQVALTGGFTPHHVATANCNQMWDHALMTVDDKAKEEAALAELDRLTAAYKRAEAAREKARDALHTAIVKHLMERNAPPGKVAEHTPYDRNHVGRIAKAAGVPPLRPRTVRSVRAEG
jgi:hypothetical protein